MAPIRGAAVVAHGGGPTPVLNASLAGIIAESRRHPAITALYGARRGAIGLLKDELCDLSATDNTVLEALSHAPGSAIGSSRRELEKADCLQIVEVMRQRDVRYLFYTGGNGSMDTAWRLGNFASEAGYEMRVIGVPKTIDNDLAGTDHTPGYPSCARFFAHAVRDIGEDNRALPPPIEIVEVLGRNTGWVVAATALARHYEDDPPHLIYFPESGVSPDRLCADVERVYRRFGRCLIAVCEGQTDDRGGWFGAELNNLPGARDPLPANMGQVLAKLIWSGTGLRTRAEKPGLLGRSCSTLASETDREESWRCGEAAVRAAVEGHSGEMVSIQRFSDPPYRSTTTLVPLESVAGKMRQFPLEWMAAGRNDVTPEFLDWARPLIGRVEPYVRL
ncbi:MAG TPA: diphosphate--fructose-6-phosphate 1-phosphotransferase [Candidatus Acidoferrales bacterium]|jgi:6-phosphofructokinase|nr:diphosphate--fructose-6-phosphate 1-phosphotransferase [Candidatus Acidoferrales bacterium]